MIVLGLACSLLPAAPAAAGDGTFSAARAFEIPGLQGAQAVAVGDFNDDGDQDLAVANSGNGSVTIRPGGPGASFPDEAAFSIGVGSFPRSIAVGDFNIDGDDDLAVSNFSSNNVTVLPGTTGNGFGTAVTLGTGVAPTQLVVGDFNPGFDEDLAIANENNGTGDVTVRLGGAGATFDSNFNLAADAGPDSLAIGDFDNDGAQDLAVANKQSDNVTVRPGDFVSGTFPPGESSTVSAIETPDGIAVGDFDGDRDEDLAFATDTGFGVPPGFAVRFGGAGSSFPSARALVRPFEAGANPQAVALGDFDSDGVEDIAVVLAQSGEDRVRVLRRAPRFPSSAQTDVGVAISPSGLAVGDFDNDGNQDLVTANFGGSSASVRPGGGPPALAGSLLENGGFEGPGAAQTFDDPGGPIPGWTLAPPTTMTSAIYGVPTNRSFPSRLQAARFAGGLNLLWGRLGVTSTATQTVPLPRRARRAIAAGRASITLSALLGGTNFESDTMTAKAELLRGNGSTLRTLRIGPVTQAQRRTLTTLLLRSKTRQVPDRARRARVTLTATNDGDKFNFGLADNVALRLDLGCDGERSTKIGTHLDDRLRGGRGADVITGLGGPDKLIGRGGADRLCGGAGRDKLKGGSGFDICKGGPGRDKASRCEVERSIP